MTDLEITYLGKGLGFSSTPTFVNEADLKRDFANLARNITCKWFFCNEPTDDRIKSNWSPPKSHPALEMCLSQMEEEIFSFLPGDSVSYNLTKEKWKAMRGLAEDGSIVIKSAEKRSSIVLYEIS